MTSALSFGVGSREKNNFLYLFYFLMGLVGEVLRRNVSLLFRVPFSSLKFYDHSKFKTGSVEKETDENGG